MSSRPEYVIVAQQLVARSGRDGALRYADSNIRAQEKLGNKPGVEGWKAIKEEVQRLGGSSSPEAKGGKGANKAAKGAKGPKKK